MITVRKFLLIFAFTLFSFITGCNDEGSSVKIPFVIVNEDINLLNLQYQDLQNIGGSIYLNGGYKGLIIYNNGDGQYKAFERACTHDPDASCTPIEVDDSGLFMAHTCCGSSFSFDGYPTGGPATYSLLQYNTFVDGNYLLIRNE